MECIPQPNNHGYIYNLQFQSCAIINSFLYGFYCEFQVLSSMYSFDAALSLIRQTNSQCSCQSDLNSRELPPFFNNKIFQNCQTSNFRHNCISRLDCWKNCWLFQPNCLNRNFIVQLLGGEYLRPKTTIAELQNYCFCLVFFAQKGYFCSEKFGINLQCCTNSCVQHLTRKCLDQMVSSRIGLKGRTFHRYTTQIIYNLCILS